MDVLGFVNGLVSGGVNLVVGNATGIAIGAIGTFAASKLVG